MVGHRSEKTICVELGKSFYWPDMKQDVEHYVCTYVKYQGAKSMHKKKYGLHNPLLILNGPFENISLDFMMCLPSWEEKDIILMILNMFSKLVKFGPTKIITSVVETITLFFDVWVKHHSMPKVIVSDQNAKFALEFWTFFMKKVGTKFKFSIAFH
jgi:hypothetical protein